MSTPQTVTNAHPVPFDHATYLAYGDAPPAEAIWDAKVRALDALIEQGRMDDDEPLHDQIAYLDARWPHWVDEVNGLGAYVPATSHQQPSEGAWMWVWGPKVFGLTTSGKRTAELMDDGTARREKTEPVVRAAGRSDEQVEETVMAHIKLAADGGEPLGARALREEVGGNREQTARVLDALIAAGRVEKRRGKVGNSVELWPIKPESEDDEKTEASA